jgi:hypothetical protein
MKKQVYSESIYTIIQAFPRGYVFTAKELAGKAASPAIRQALTRLTSAGTIRRLSRGVYQRPRHSALLEGPAPASIDEIAHAIARAHKWTIVPAGSAALNILRLSTQVPATWEYLSDGPSKTYTLEASTLRLTHRANKEITGLSPMTALLVQALKALGPQNIDEQAIEHLKALLNPPQKKAALKEAKLATEWVYRAILEIAGGEAGGSNA